MKWHRVFLYFPLFCCAVSLNAHSQVVWLSPRPAADYLSLFEKNAPWERVSAQVSVIAMPVNFILNRPDGDLQKIFADMSRKLHTTERANSLRNDNFLHESLAE